MSVELLVVVTEVVSGAAEDERDDVSSGSASDRAKEVNFVSVNNTQGFGRRSR